MEEVKIKRAIKSIVEESFLNKKVSFKNSDETESFVVREYKIRSRKSIGIERYEFDDYGIDEDTDKFIIVEFWDAVDEMSVMDATSCIFTLNSKGQLGTCCAPFNFELTVAYDTANELVDRICDTYKMLS